MDMPTIQESENRMKITGILVNIVLKKGRSKV